MGLKKKVQYPELSENEKKLQEKAATGTLEEIQSLLQDPDVKVNCLDESGMTPLQQAAFRNKLDTAEFLLARGADVNSNMHENGYTALMFAALSGNTDMTRLMLKHGARKDRINSVKRNAAQMAAFVGQHQCVAVINNYYDKSDLEYFTIIQGQEKEPKLPPMVLPATLTLLNMSNLHPVKVSYHLQDHPELMNDSYKVCKVLDLICERAMKARDTDDVMAMKAHYFATVIRKAKDADSLDKWMKWLVKGREQDGYPEVQDQLIRQSLKEFPYVDSQLLHTMVRQLSQTKIGDHPTSYNILMQGVNGQKFAFDEETECSTCGEMKASKCVKCKMVAYCDRRCQKLHWSTHKKFCASLAEEYKRIQAVKKKEEEEAEKKKLEQEQELPEVDKARVVEPKQETSVEDKQASGDGARVVEPTQETSVEDKQTTGPSQDDKQASGPCQDDQQASGDGASDSSNKEGDVKTEEEKAEFPDIETLLSDPAIQAAFKDKDIQRALTEIKNDPLNIKQYTEDKQLQQLIENVTSKVTLPKKEEETQDTAKETQDTAKESGS